MPVARPDRNRNTHDRLEADAIARCSPVRRTIAHAKTATTTVRNAVASVDGSPSTPILARMAVSAAAAAEINAYVSHAISASVPDTPLMQAADFDVHCVRPYRFFLCVRRVLGIDSDPTSISEHTFRSRAAP